MSDHNTLTLTSPYRHYITYLSSYPWFLLQGISAQEVTNFFFDKETRLEWEGTLESVDTVETLAEDTIVFHQLHKRVWPSTQRESLFCSHLCTLSGAPQPENMIGHTWMVCNFSMDHDSVPVCAHVSHLITNLLISAFFCFSINSTHMYCSCSL